MSVKRSMAVDKHSIANNLMDITKYLTINANESISTSYDTVAALVTEMVDVTSNHCTKENASGIDCSNCEIPLGVKEKSTTDVSNSTKVENVLIHSSNHCTDDNASDIDCSNCQIPFDLKEKTATDLSNSVDTKSFLIPSSSHSTEKKISEISSSNFQIPSDLKEKLATDVSNSTNAEDLPIRRSSRIQCRTDVKKKGNQKELKQNKNAKSPSNVEKDPLVVSNEQADNDHKINNLLESKHKNKRASSVEEKPSLSTDEPLENDAKRKSNRKDTKQNKSEKVTPVKQEASPSVEEKADNVEDKSNQKESKQEKNTKALAEKESLLVSEKPVKMLISESSKTDSIPNKPDSISLSNKDEVGKRVSSRRIQKKEKETMKVDEKNASDKKRPYNRKKKLSSLELDKSIDQVISDVIKSSFTDAPDHCKMEDTSANLNDENDCSMQNVEQGSEIVQDNIKEDIEDAEIKEKDAESNVPKPVKVKSRWWRSSELEGVLGSDIIPGQDTSNAVPMLENPVEAENILSPVATEPVAEEMASLATETIETTTTSIKMEIDDEPLEVVEKVETKTVEEDIKMPEERPNYEHIDDNIYRFTKKKSKSKKQVRRMVCDCTLTKEEQECGILGCKEECLNKLLMIECGYRCPLGHSCSNKKFQKKQYMKSEIFKAEKKGWGLRALEDICRDDFLIEFVGEIINHKEYRQRVKQYAKDKIAHFYFMAFKTDEILDATIKGNTSRFINHSCDPNCETQKWTVNGELRVGVFAKRSIPAGEEYTLDYKFQCYGREAQKCFCGSYNCTGFIGGAKQISIDAYGISKTGASKKKKGFDDKKRDLDDIALEDEIEKLNSSKGLRNKEETLKLARLMVRAEESATRHQLLDIIIKTEEQACLRLFLDYHGLPLMWSWMTDMVDLDLKSKILQVLSLLPITNKTMLLDSKVMNVVEKWVQENNAIKIDNSSNEKSPDSILTSPADESSEPLPKKLKNIEFSDSETDSTGSHNANDNSSETSSITDTIKAETMLTDDVQTTGETVEPLKENKLSENVIKDERLKDPDVHLKTNISNIGAGLLSSWKNLKEVFRIPKLEQQKRKEDEMEADHSVLMRTEKKTEVEVTGDQIQVLVSTFTPRFSHDRIYENDNPEVDFKVDDLSNNNLLPILTTTIKRFNKQPLNKEAQRIVKEEIKPPLQTDPRTLLPNPAYLNPPPVTFPPPVNPGVAPPTLLKQPPPQAMYPHPQIVYPQSQIPFVNTAAPPPIISHPTSSMPPPAQILQQPSPSLLHAPSTNYLPPNTSLPPPGTNLPPPSTNLPPNTNLPPPNANLPPPNANLPPSNTNLPPPHTSLPPPVNAILPSNPANFQSSVNMPPPSTHYMQNQPPTAYPPPAQNPYANQSQPPFYYMQQHGLPNSSAQATFTENVCVQTSASLPLPVANSLTTQALTYPSSNSFGIQPVNSIPMQSTASLPHQLQATTSLPILSSTLIPSVQPQPLAPVVLEEPKPVKLPKNWRSATDEEGNVYYYHSVTRETQWDPPTSDQIEEDDDDDSEDEEEDSESEESESSDTPTYDEPKISTKHSKRKSKKRKTTKAAADTSVSFPVRPEVAKKIKELFRTKMSSYIVHCLNGYRKPDCKVGRITNNEDFKYLARKLTHYTMTKELKQCKNVEDLDCNEQVMHKAKDFIKKYMSKYGSKFSRKEKFSPEP